ncbi:MAG: DUF5060 domain-containing protein [Eubacteriales bacterium]|jgi:hypothetical protein
MVRKYDIYEITLNGPTDGNPFTDVDLSAVFIFRNRKQLVSGFYDGDGTYKIRFMPCKEGEWHYETQSNVDELNGITGEFTCVESAPGEHGPVRVHKTYHFAHDDGTPYYPVGTTAYAWTHQEPEIVEQTLKTLKDSPFNKIRMCVFPKHYVYNLNEPPMYPYVGGLTENAELDLQGAGPSFAGTENTAYKFDLTRFNPEFWRDFETRVAQLRELGIQADIIIFHPYDRWGFSRMDEPDIQLYLRYLVARLGAYSNVWWSMANEYDLFRTKTEQDWERWAYTVVEWDPFEHLRSIHNCNSFYDHSKGWISHVSLQRIDYHSHVELVAKWREKWRKPVVVDEICYEGDLDHGFGNVSGEELTKRFWDITVRGGYGTHGETYLRDDEVLWWAKGGWLTGTSPERLAFLREIVEEMGYIDPKPFSPMDWDLPWGFSGKRFSFKMDTRTPYGAATIHAAEKMICYFSFAQPAKRSFILPEDMKYEIEIIDTWNMTITKLDGLYSGRCEIKLPAKQYIAVRFTLASNSGSSSIVGVEHK